MHSNLEEPLHRNSRNDSPNFPVAHWHKLIPLAELTLNCLLPWQPNPEISAYHGLTGSKFDFRAHPIAPAGTAILIYESPEVRGSWAGHGVPGFYIGPALQHYRSHNVHVTATSAPRVTDTVAWFPETPVTSPQSDEKEMLIAAIKDFLQAITKYNLIGEFPSPTLVQDLQDLASLHNTAIAPTIPLTAPVIGTETRVGSHGETSVQEKRVVMLPTLASANPLHTTPSAPTPIVALISTIYPPLPGLPPLPNTDRPNVLLDNPVALPTVPVAPPRRTSHPHTVRGPSSFGYSAVTVPTTYSHKVRADENITT